MQKSFEDTEKSYTAFENERNLKQNEISSEEESFKGKLVQVERNEACFNCRGAAKFIERVLWKDLHKTDKVVQEARMKKFILG